MILETIPYSEYEKDLPQQGKAIIGQTKDDHIFVYQAFNDAIADFAVANQQFGGPAYSFSRMTWIKPNFLWMMYRSGWAEKPDQNRILAVEMSLAGFFKLLGTGILTTHDRSYDSKELWRNALERSNVRIQWDPDHGPAGQELNRRAVQIGIKGSSLEQFNNEYIRSITDISGFVQEQQQNRKKNEAAFRVIKEASITINDELRNRFSIP